MKFIDGKEYSPEDWGYLVLTKENRDKELKKKEEDPNYRPSLEFVKEYIQTPVVYQYRMKIKDFKVGETFYRGADDYYLNIILE